MVFRAPQTHRSFQPPCVLPGVQRIGKNMAPYACSWNAQSIFLHAERIAFNFNFNVSKYSEESIAGARIPETLSMIAMSL